MTDLETGRGGGAGTMDLHLVDAVEVVIVAVGAKFRIAAVLLQPNAFASRTIWWSPPAGTKPFMINRQIELLLQIVDPLLADVRVDRQTERDSRGFDRRQRADIVVQRAVVRLLLRRIGREYRAAGRRACR